MTHKEHSVPLLVTETTCSEEGHMTMSSRVEISGGEKGKNVLMHFASLLVAVFGVDRVVQAVLGIAQAVLGIAQAELGVVRVVLVVAQAVLVVGLVLLVVGLVLLVVARALLCVHRVLA